MTPIDEAWIDAYEAQATDELFAKATRYATSRAEGVARAGGLVDDLYIRELVQDAFTDTLLGTLAWDPRRASLEQQVISAIRSRTRHDREHARRFRRMPLDRAEIEAALAAQADDDEAAAFAAERVAELRALASNDADVIRLLDATQAGAGARQEIREATGMSAKRYRNARWRLAALVKKQPGLIKHPPERA